MEYVTNEWASSKPELATFCAKEQENLANPKKKKKKNLSLQREGRLAGTEKGEILNGFMIWVSGFSHAWIYPLKCQLSHSISYLSKLSPPKKKKKRAQSLPAYTNTR